MALSPEEQQQLEEFRDWWKANLVWVLLGAGLALGGVGGYKGWNYWQDQSMMGAAALYQQYRTHLEDEQAQQAHEMGERLRNEYGGTSYALMASLISARLHQEDQQVEEAIRLLGWAHETSDDPLFTPVAALRLARLHAAQQQWEKGLAVLADVSLEGYEGLVHEIRGDLYRQSGRAQEARHEYVQALEKGNGGEFLELKLAELGEQSEAD
ncbi:MAG: tetratricopeptide repeat protein [Gammaproteobacteria bacterium]|nr:tetratricopeptide repeat protein [Gammaproteobacteria bacterium]